MAKQLRRTLAGVLCGVMIFAMIAPTTQVRAYSVDKITGTGVITSEDGLNVRSGPGSSYNKIGGYGFGSTATITGVVTENGSTWYEVNYNGSTGYVSGDYIKVTKNDSGTDSGSTSTGSNSTEGEKRSVTSNDGLNLRTEAGATGASTIIYGLPYGAVLTILDKTTVGGTTWYKVEYKGNVGYVSGDFVSEPITNPDGFVNSNTNTGPVTISEKRKVDTYGGLNLRTEPGATGNNTIVYVIPDGSIVTILDTTKVGNKTWYKVDYKGNIGYVSGDYLSEPIAGGASEVDIQSFAQELRGAGFPESYIENLCELHIQHPNWRFTPQFINRTWNEVVAGENKVGINMVLGSAKASWKSMDEGAYDFNNNRWYELDSGGWVAASEQIISYFMDPRNFLDEDIYQFLDLSYDSSAKISDSDVESILKGTTMAGLGSDIIAAAKEVGCNPLMLAVKMRQEQGASGNGLDDGSISGYEGYYNYFNIGAWVSGGNSAIVNGAIYAKNHGWDTPYKAILGGAKLMGNGYVNVGQNTLYLQKFDVADSTPYSHQYMGNIHGAMNEGAYLRSAFEQMGSANANLTFRIPVYRDMPDNAYPLPTSSGNNNNLLESLTVSGCKLDKNFYRYTTSYSTSVSGNSVTINAVPSDSGAKVSGAGTVSLVNGKNTISITVTAPSGVKRVYKIEITATVNSGGTNATAFTDISPKDSYYNAVVWALEKGITTGTTTTTFSPKETCTRGQIVTFLWREAGCPQPKTKTNPFKDVSKDWYYYSAILWAVEKGITTGTTTTTFSPDEICTRGQIITFLWRAKGSPAPKTKTNPYTDVPNNWYYRDSILWAVENGIAVPTSSTKFSPDSYCTRASSVTFMYNCKN